MFYIHSPPGHPNTELTSERDNTPTVVHAQFSMDISYTSSSCSCISSQHQVDEYTCDADVPGTSLCLLPFSTVCMSHVCLFTCTPPPLPPPRGPAQCWRQRCPGVSRPHWGSVPAGHDTAPRHTSSASPSPDLPPQYLLWGCGSP